MLPRAHRLTKEDDFQKIWKSGRSFYTKIIGFKVLAKNDGPSRFGIVVGNKISKKAVLRNKIKRQMREIIGKNLGQIKPGYDISLSALPGAADKTYKDLEKEILSGFAHFKLLLP